MQKMQLQIQNVTGFLKITKKSFVQYKFCGSNDVKKFDIRKRQGYFFKIVLLVSVNKKTDKNKTNIHTVI